MSGEAALTPVTYDALAGWAEDDLAPALAAFRRGAAVLADHPPKQRPLGADPHRLAALVEAAADADDARTFFERHFVPHAVGGPRGAHFTGYYEPEVDGSRVRGGPFQVPLHARPPDLVEVAPLDAGGAPDGYRFARKTAHGLEEFADRRAIMAGALDGKGLELAWLADPVDAFFVHIQGAACIRLPDGKTMRVTYAAKSGHPYTPIGRVLIDEGALSRGTATMQTIRAWLADHPDRRDRVLAANRSYIFFREAPVGDPAAGPIAAAKVPLTSGRSLAVDRTLHAFHTPVWVETQTPDGVPLRRLTVAQDTGSAIVGAARGDIFFGSGEAAGDIAGRMNARGRFVVLMPRETAA